MSEPKRRLLFVGAHPDDESFGLGGTLGRYAAEGAEVSYACATRGEVGAADPEHLQGYATPGDMRWAELMCAARELGLARVIHLGYRDSGMPGAPEIRHPDALAAAPLEEVTARVVGVLREMRPQVVITFDPIGGYRHPDHIAIHAATVQAFEAAGDAARFPDRGPAYRPQKLYYQVFPRHWLRWAVRVLPLLGQDPRRFGRNRDIDLTDLAGVEFPIHAVVDIRGEANRRRQAASACHASQQAGGPAPRGVVGAVLSRLGTQREVFMRAYPPVDGRTQPETDLFAGVQVDR
jgi:N-acetyl-1-D-myo-inositol-2-amino-2-deoxy-alpha-D-glucopyranoside deacetylase/mycothiol S-conjugate amidase